jgi:hypothetical protein
MNNTTNLPESDSYDMRLQKPMPGRVLLGLVVISTLLVVLLFVFELAPINRNLTWDYTAPMHKYLFLKIAALFTFVGVIGYVGSHSSTFYFWAGIGSVVILLTLAMLLVGSSGNIDVRRNLAASIYMIWTIGLPLWFLGEIGWHAPFNKNRKVAEDWKLVRDDFKFLWAGVTLILTALLLTAFGGFTDIGRGA